MSEDSIETTGTVVAVHPNTMFTVKLEGSKDEKTVLATLGGKLRLYYIKVILGDRVIVKLSPYDLTRGRITYRYKQGEKEG